MNSAQPSLSVSPGSTLRPQGDDRALTVVQQAFLPAPCAAPRMLSWSNEASIHTVELAADPVVTVGTFDGVHQGHQVLIEHARRWAQQHHTSTVAVTFDPHPLKVVAPRKAPLLLTSVAQRVQLLKAAGVDAVMVVPFSPQIAAWSPLRFIDEVLVKRLGAGAVWVGQDFRFGTAAAGTVETLRQDGRFAVEALALHPDLSQPARQYYSATRARALIAAGQMEQAAQVLGRLWQMQGQVVRGQQRGRQLGFPTANLASESPELVLPADGVYAGTVALIADANQPTQHAGLEQGHWVPAAISVGTNPTFEGVARQVEAYVLNRDDLQLYGCQLAVRFVRKVRPTLRFSSVDELIVAMQRDVEQIGQIMKFSQR